MYQVKFNCMSLYLTNIYIQKVYYYVYVGVL